MKEIKDDYKTFLIQDDTQAFMFTFVAFTVLLIAGYIDLQSFTKIMMVGVGGFFGQKLTNRM